MGWVGDTVDSIKSIQIRQFLTQAVSLGTVPSALIAWHCDSWSVALSGSMEPGLKRVRSNIWFISLWYMSFLPAWNPLLRLIHFGLVAPKKSWRVLVKYLLQGLENADRIKNIASILKRGPISPHIT